MLKNIVKINTSQQIWSPVYLSAQFNFYLLQCYQSSVHHGNEGNTLSTVFIGTMSLVESSSNGIL